jgi:hypothetical protein
MVVDPTHQDFQPFQRIPSLESAELHIEQTKSHSVEQECRRRKKVHFHDSVYIRETLHLLNYSDDERQTTWYTRKDDTRMRAETKKTLDLLRSGDYKGDSEQHCSRGLECRVGKAATMRQFNKMKGLLAVLEEQENQNYEQKRRDHRAIAVAYALVTKHCVTEASKMGELDEIEASGASASPEVQHNADNLHQSKRRRSFTLDLFKRIKR